MLATGWSVGLEVGKGMQTSKSMFHWHAGSLLHFFLLVSVKHGLKLGDALGDRLGAKVGSTDGLNVGDIEGKNVGEELGLRLG